MKIRILWGPSRAREFDKEAIWYSAGGEAPPTAKVLRKLLEDVEKHGRAPDVIEVYHSDPLVPPQRA